MKELEIVLMIYRELISKNGKNGIPVEMRSKATPSSQDDPFHHWIENEIRIALPKNFEIVHSGSLTTPDILIRDKSNGTIVGIETKKLVQKPNGSDSRGLTIDYNSCLPCGSALVKVGAESVIVPCFYLFALLDATSAHILTLIIMDGDFLNYDFELHKESKYANISEYRHGPYEEGSVRHRRMYTYPNPLNSKIQGFYHRKIFIAKKIELEKIKEDRHITEQIVRTDKHGNSFFYLLKDETRESSMQQPAFKTLIGIFDSCKKRTPKDRSPSIPYLPPIVI